MSDFHNNLEVCLNRCGRARRQDRSTIVCSADGGKIREHAQKGDCPAPEGNRFDLAAKLALKQVGSAARNECNGGDDLVKLAEARIAKLEPICQSCTEMVQISRRDQPLVVHVLCNKEKCCGGNGPGLVDLIYGRCPIGKHEAAIGAWDEERKAGGSCH